MDLGPLRVKVSIALLALGSNFPGPAVGAQAKLDLHKTQESDGVYAVSFCARPFPDSVLSIPPHAFVAWSQLPAAGKRSYKVVGTVPGLQPKALLGFSTSFSPVPVEITEQNYASLIDRCLTLPVNKVDYQRAFRLGQASLAQISTALPPQPISATYSLPPEESVNLFVALTKLFEERGMGVPRRGGSEPPPCLSAPHCGAQHRPPT